MIDTNTVLDMTFWQDPGAAPIEAAMQSGALTPVRDESVMIELAEVLSRPHFTGSEDRALETVAAWAARAAVIPAEKTAEAESLITVQCRDPLDQKFLVLTLAARAPLLVSKDKLVLKAGRKMKKTGVTAVRPDQFEKAFADVQRARAEYL